jgi:hypothetical protein
MPENHPEWQKHFATLPDSGPLYTETNLSNFIVEPWNAATSLAFLLPAIYWAYFLRKDYKEYWFLIYCSILLFIGGTGSTLFHALRSSKFLITLDFLPMAIATFSICIYFWHKLLKKWHWVLLIVLPFFALRYLIFNHLGHHNSINASYFLSGVLFFIPLLLLLFKNDWQNSTFALASLVSFVVSLFFRQIDAYDPPLFSIGTHFLWHLFGALGAHFIAVYIYKLELSDKKPS